MKQESIYSPEWISAQDAAAWLGIEENSLYRWRAKFGLHWSNISGKTIMYDKKQLNQLLNENSTYATLNRGMLGLK